MTGDFSASDLRQLEQLGISAAEAERQLDLLLNPPPSIRLDRPCRIGDGIRRLEASQYPERIELFESAARRGRLSRLVPASGAASRMFKSLLPFLNDAGEPGRKELERRVARGGRSAADLLTLVDQIDRFAFSGALDRAAQRRGQSLSQLVREEAYVMLCRLLLTDAGLNYAELPKALIEFHRYPEGARTALEEQLVEASATTVDAGRISRNHFTVAPGFESRFGAELEPIQSRQARLGVELRIGLSTQDRCSDTLAIGPDRRPFRLDDGTLLLRPAGHGALIENLGALGGDLVFLKNIDNILPERLQAAPVRWKKILCGTLLDLERRIHGWIRRLEPSDLAIAPLAPCFDFLAAELGSAAPAALRGAPAERQRAFLLERLRRPLRVCGVVPNQGEPGGGPFWVQGPDQRLTLQIVERTQVDAQSEAQRQIWSAATHFNPVDMVCSLRDPEGIAYDLRRFMDPRAVLVAKKSHQGRELLALERPGLWNGAMADWNTVFVEVPAETFAPVKTVFDLLRPEHQSEA